MTEDKPKFTPGPWIIETSRYDETIIRTDYSEDRNVEAGRGWDEDIIIAEGIEWGLVDDEEIEANAHAISAVPDMYEALAALLGRWSEFNASYGNQEDAYYKLAKYARPQWDAAAAALAKAEGRKT